MSASPEHIQQQQGNTIQDWSGQNYGLSCDKFGDMAWMPVSQNVDPLLGPVPTTNGGFAMDLCQPAYTSISPIDAMQQQMDVNDTVMPSQLYSGLDDAASSINSVPPSPFSYEGTVQTDEMMSSTHTSPTDFTSPSSATVQPQIKTEPGAKGQSIREHKKQGATARQRRRSSQQSIASPITKPATTPITTTTTAAPSASETTSNPRPTTEGKKKTVREKNRTAATKYRNKTKRSIAGLQEMEHQLSEKNAVLSAHVDCLRNEILTLKNEILRHGTCESPMIQDYIMKTAKQL